MACPLHYATCVTLKIEKTSKQRPAPAGAAAVLPPDEHGFLWIDSDGFPKAFAADVDAVEARVVAAVQKPLSINSFTAKSGPPAWKHLAFLVHGCDRRADDSSPSGGIHGEKKWAPKFAR
jgi:hypothetical protein